MVDLVPKVARHDGGGMFCMVNLVGAQCLEVVLLIGLDSAWEKYCR